MPAVDPIGHDLISVVGAYHEELSAISADLWVTVKGSSLVTGSAALTKAREVGQLVADLKNFGQDDKDIKLQSVRAEVSSGILGKSSSAMYTLQIHCERLDQLADILGIVTAQKNTALKQIGWNYDTDESAFLRRLALAIDNANARAKVVAASLGVKLLGVHRFEETIHETDRYESQYDPDSNSMMRESMAQYSSTPRLRAADLGLVFSHSQQISVFVKVLYRVSEFERS